MRKLETKKAYFYPIKDRDGSPLELMNVLTYVKNDEGKEVLYNGARKLDQAL